MVFVEEGNQKMIIICDVTFNENEIYHSLKLGLNASRENKEVRNKVEVKVESQIEDTKTGRQPQEPEFTEK